MVMVQIVTAAVIICKFTPIFGFFSLAKILD